MRPTQAQYASTFSSFRHKDDAIPQAEVTGLQEALNTKASAATLAELTNRLLPTTLTQTAGEYYELPANVLLREVFVEFQGGVDQPFKLGTTAGGEDVIEATNIELGGILFSIGRKWTAVQRLYVSGFTGTLTITYYKN